MNAPDAALGAAAALMVVTALTHAILGERRLIGPILASDIALMRRPLARQVLRYAWHLTSILMILSAATLVWPGVPRGLVLAVALVWLVVGLLDAVLTRGEHVGWPLLAGAGALAVTAIIGEEAA